MNRRRYVTFFVAAAVWLALSFGLATVPALAQTSQQQINSGLCSGANLQFSDNPSTAGCNDAGATKSINNIVHSIINLLSAVVGIVAVVMIIVGGLRYITSGGNDTSVTSAKNTILYAIIGLIIVAVSQILVRFTLNKVTNG